LLVLDTDHFSEWERASAAGERLRARLEATQPEMAVTVITVEEQMRGWLAEISRHHEPHGQIAPYAKLHRQVEVFADWLILPWAPRAAESFLNLRHQGVRVGSLDLKIACITLEHGATLLTRNTSDFARVPGLQIENWLD
jgi:tRNA(fMet)-specific endonuclease VapC